MTSLYKLIFDLTVYYTLTGFYLNIATKAPVSYAGFILLCLTAGAYLLALRKKTGVWLRRGALLLPILLLLTRPALWSAVHMLPAWAYLAWCLEKENYGEDYQSFRRKFLFGLRLQLLCLPGLILSRVGTEAAVASLPYCLILLAVGICCLRCLRQNVSAVKAGLGMLGFLAVGLVLTVAGVPAFFLRILSWIYNNVIVFLFQAAASVLLLIVTSAIQLLAEMSRLSPGNKHQNVDTGAGSVQEILGIPEKVAGAGQTPMWLIVAGYIAAGVAVIGVLIWLAIRLLGSLDREKPVAVVYSQTAEKAASVQRTKLTKPKDPRGRVRYYYALFLRECKKRGMELHPGMTEGELTVCCAPCFPGADPKDLATVYSPARYWDNCPVSPAQAEAAAKAWSRLKRTKYRRPEHK